MKLTAKDRKLLRSYGIAPIERRPARDRFLVVTRFEDGSEASRSAWQTLALARKAAKSGARIGVSEIFKIDNEEAVLEVHMADGRVIR